MGAIKLKHSSGNSTILNSPAANPSSDITLKLPSTTGSAGQVLKIASANHSSTNAELEFAADAGGKILQVVQTVKNDVYNADVAVGAYGVDVPGLTVSITPSNASNKILVSIAVSLGFQDSTPQRIAATIFKGGSVLTGATGDASGNIQRITFAEEIGTYSRMSTVSGSYLDTAGSTNATTYSVRISHGYDGTKSIFVNRASSSAESNHSYHMRAISTITAMEVSA